MAKAKTLWIIQSWSKLSRPGRAEDGPPYGPPGMWIDLNEYDNEADAKAGLKRVMNPHFGHRPDGKYRVIKHTPVVAAKPRPKRTKQLVAA